jgi:hypothetical protein
MATPSLSIPASRDKRTVGRILYVSLSYTLAFGMLPYAVSKILAVQFQVFASIYAQPLSSVYGFFAIAAFFGRFRWLEVLLGFVEFVPSVLLLFRRTRGIGAVLLLGPILFITVIDYAYPAMGYVLVISAMLVVDLVLLMLDAPTRRWLFALFTLGKGVTHRYRWLEFVVAVLLASTIIVPFWRQVHQFETERGDFTGRPQINGRGTWDITSLVIDGTPVDLKAGKESPKIYFDFDGVCRIAGLRDTPIDCRFEPNGNLHTIKLTHFPLGASSVSVQGSYQVAGSTLAISGSAESHTISVTLSRSGW